MGALLSLPLLALPSVATLWSVAASCCGAATCTALCNACGKFQSSMATRIAYAFILLLNSIFAWIMLTPWAIRKLEHLTLDYMTFQCGSHECYGYMAVQRINFALGLFHFLLSFTLIGVRNTKDGRAGLQNGFWGPKLIAWIAFIIISFFIPEEFFMFYGKYIAFTGAMLFVLLGLILLVDLAHTWVELCLDKAEDETNSNSSIWRWVLVGSTFSMYVATFTMTVVMYIFFSGNTCGMNNAAITINLVALLAITIISMLPHVQDENPRAGIGQAAMVAVYCTYLTFSAVCMEPDDKQCNPLIRARGARTTTIVLGAVVTLLTVAYTTTRAATQSFFGNKNEGQVYLPEDEYGPSANHVVISEQPRARRQMALQQAIAEGSLPASATLDDSDDEEEETDSKGGKHVKDDERRATQYNYSLFHVIFFLATCWVATLLTQSMDPNNDSDFTPVGRTYAASWIKIISAWVCYLIYTWSLLAPIVLTGRDFSG
ncbi:Membrane protein tms1 [Lithohypha guttulata]|uniref:Membrane protein tms1 n=1 Tax=Lithohypha guttulata TaxID=1690604 RepID=A0AAN7YHC3_9EURO|nr:Membrane protein tms1 [Lithohypha guttulata]